MSRGFIQIPILVAIVLSAAVFGAGGYFVARNSEDNPPPSSDSQTAVVTATQEESSATTTKDDGSTDTEIESEEKTADDPAPAPAAENFASVVTVAYENRIKFDKQIIEYLDASISYVDRYLQRMENTRDDTELFYRALGKTDTATEKLLDYYDSDIAYIESYKDGFVQTKQKFLGDISFYENRKVQATNSFIGRTEAISLIEETNNLSGYHELLDFAEKWLDDFIASREKADRQLELAFELADSKLKTVSQPVYYSPPQTRAPTMVNTLCDTTGSTIYCQTISF